MNRLIIRTIWTLGLLSPSLTLSAQVVKPQFIEAGADTTSRSYLNKAGDSLSIVDFGADPAGVSDSTASIEAAARRAKALGKALYIPDGTFVHKGTDTFDSIVVFGTGTIKSIDTTLPNPSHALILTGDNVEMRGVTVTTSWVGRRQQNDTSAAILVWKANRYKISDVKIIGSASVGIMQLTGAAAGQIIGNNIEGTLADGIHSTSSANNIVISGNILKNTGDDSIAVVGYLSGNQPSNFLITGNKSYDSHTRGITCIGCKQVVIEGNTVERPAVACINVSAESSYSTYGVTDVVVKGNQLVDCNTNKSSVNAGIFSGGYKSHVVSGLKVLENHISFTKAVTTYAPGIDMNNTYVIAPIISDNSVEGAPSFGIRVNCVSPEVINNVVVASASHGILAESATTGVLRIVGNRVVNSATSGTTNKGHINIENSSITRAIIQNNTMIDGLTAPVGVRYIPTRETLIAAGNTQNGKHLRDSP